MSLKDSNLTARELCDLPWGSIIDTALEKFIKEMARQELSKETALLWDLAEKLGYKYAEGWVKVKKGAK
jgi:hypothetical protein